MSNSTFRRFLVILLCAIVIFVALTFVNDTVGLVSIAALIFIAIIGGFYKFDYLHPATVYLVPWLMILIFSIVPISSYARPMESATYELLLATMFAWLLSCVSAPAGASSAAERLDAPPDTTFPIGAAPAASFVLTSSVIFLFTFAAFNVMVAGYVPLLSLLTTGESRYMEFGIPSIYGAYLAYANALGCVAFYLYLRTGRRKHLALFGSILVMHLVFITRQNLITLLVEAFVIRCMARGRVSKPVMVVSLALALGGFAFLGSLRSGDIKEIIGVQQQYTWIPGGLIWLYAYSYFNALNIDNMIVLSGAPFFDGFMWESLLPTRFRPDNTHETFVELASMGISSYIYPIYMDIGKGVIFFAGAMGFFTAAAYRRALEHRRFVDIATYSCLFFCALLSFFTDFWLYLPVIFQVVFFRIFHTLLFKIPATSRHSIVDRSGGVPSSR